MTVSGQTSAPKEPTSPRFAHARLFIHPEAIVPAILAALIVVLSIAKPDLFATPDNFRVLLLGAAIVVVLAVGQTFVVVSAGIDLSIGGILVLASVLSVKLMTVTGSDSSLALCLGLFVALAVGALCGGLNGLLVARLGLSPIIVTLATSSVTLGIAYVITDGSDLRSVPANLNQLLIETAIAGIPILVWVAAAVALVAGLALSLTGFGRHTYAVGSDITASRRAGIDVNRQLIAIYGLSGVLAGLAAYLSVGRFTTTSLAGYGTVSLQVVTAVALGGASLFGGRGTILGTVVGVFIPVTLQNGLIILGIESYWQQVITGLVLLAAIAFDKFTRASQRRA